MGHFYPINFDPAEYLGLDDGSIDEDSTWGKWIRGDEPRFPKEFARYCYWHLDDALGCYVTWDKREQWPDEYRGGSDQHEERFREAIAINFRTVSDLTVESWYIHPFSFDSLMFDRFGTPELDTKFIVQTLCAYCVKCFDDGISGLLENMSIKASTGFSYAFRALDLVHEYRDRSIGGLEVGANLIEKQVRSSIGRKGAIAKLARDPKQNEKAFIYQCWQDWQKKTESYESKAAFARDMLTKIEHLKSQKKIEDWCREWEAGNGAQQPQ